MNIEEILSKAINYLVDRRLSNAIEVLEQLYVQRPLLMGHNEFEAIRTDYQLMVGYMRRGFSDSHRESLYSTLLQRLYRIAADLEISWRCKSVGTYVNPFRVIDHLNTNHDFVHTVLESFISDIAMLSLQPEEAKGQKSTELYDRRRLFMNRLLGALWISCQWTDDDCKFYTELLFSPTTISTDQQVIVSAINLGATNQFNTNKFKTLVNVYQQATDEHVRQRTLAGWVLAVFEGADIFPGQDVLICELCENPTITRELLTLQIQFSYSKDAEKDSDKIQRDIMPDIVRNSDLTIGRLSIMEKEEDTTEGILHQDADEKHMEQMEEKVCKMMDMQRQGSDIYFGGFSQMKRFPFFNDMVDWSAPFYLSRPALRPMISRLGDTKFLNTLMEKSNSCEPDKYSFAFASEQITNQLPSDIKEMIGSDAMLGPLAENDDVEDVISIRRTYLQDLYCFFRLYHTANDFISPSEDNDRGDFVADTFFFTYKSFMGTGLDDVKLRLASHLYKHQQMTKLAGLLTTFQNADPQYVILVGCTNIHMGKVEFTYQFFDYALKVEPDDQQVLKEEARAALDAEDYRATEEVYIGLLKLEPGHENYTMSRCVALLELGRASEVREELSRLDYQYPKDVNVKRVLTWAMLSDNNLDKASLLYDALLTSTPVHEDYLDAGYCQWAMDNVQHAVELFREWMVESRKDIEQLLEEFRSDTNTSKTYAVSETDCFLTLGLVG